jgi:hypothetical protein
LIFKSEDVSAQWDTWCFYHDRTYYLYYLITEISPGEGFGVATSTDGVTWTDHGWCLRASEEMVHYLGTGSVWPDPVRPEIFICNYSEWREDATGKRRQNILFAESKDLLSWTKLGDKAVFTIDERYYERYGRWDCIFAIPRADGGLWGTWTATPLGRENLNGGIGIGISEDGRTWTALPPPEVMPDAGESGAITLAAGKIHAMFGTGNGMDAYFAAAPDGDYRLAETNSNLLSRRNAYFSRYFNGPDGVMLNHHVMDGRKIESGRSITYVAPFKRFSVDKAGVQRWQWWNGNEALKAVSRDPTRPLDLRRGFVLEARYAGFAREAVSVTLVAEGKEYNILISPDGAVDFRTLGEGTESSREYVVDRGVVIRDTMKLRILARRGMLELYLDDDFIECWAMGCPSASTANMRFGGILTESLEAWEMGQSSGA